MQEPEDHLDFRVTKLPEGHTPQVDVGSHFETDILFPSRGELVAWARNVGKGLGFAITIRSSDKLEGGRASPRVILGCDRAGFYRESQYKKGWVKQNLRKTTSKRCGCPFSLIGQRDALCNDWKINVKCGLHNHVNMHLESHAFVGRLDCEERKIVQDMFAAGVKPRKILLALKYRNPANTTAMKTIYNERVKMRKELMTIEHQGLEIRNNFFEIMESASCQTVQPFMPNKLNGIPNGSSKKFKNDFKSTKWDPSPFEVVMMDSPLMLRNLKKAVRTMTMHKNKYFDRIRQQLPSNIWEYLASVLNVTEDGHCGYRVISESMNMGDDWGQVRNDLSNELQHREALYDDLFGSSKRKELIDSLDCRTIPAPLDKWMSMPDMGLVISSCYNVVVVQLSELHGLTFLPLYSPVPPTQKIIFIGFLNKNHFVGLRMSEGCPLPPIYAPWRRCRNQIAVPWEAIIASRLQS
ncbi:hypothetical protein KSP39_PZI019437 [Platanthera zijinensis]|uniref:OTU domain-containing protein n=1 Tax=Platanthera zijinensis TaxID=2320716 RepID=A0AAP0B206_9ASPA